MSSFRRCQAGSTAEPARASNPPTALVRTLLAPLWPVVDAMDQGANAAGVGAWTVERGSITGEVNEVGQTRGKKTRGRTDVRRK